MCTKVAYNTEGAASKSAHIQRRKKGWYLRPYLCFSCFKWHLTSMSAGDYLKRNKHITQ